MIGPIQAVTSAMSKPFTWSGRATRAEYWWFQLFYWIAYVGLFLGLLLPEVRKILAVLDAPDQEVIGPIRDSFSSGNVWLFNIAVIWLIFANWAVLVRRLHDVGLSGWFQLIPLVPILGSIVLLVALCWPSNAGRNPFGPGPGMSDEDARTELARSAWTAVPEVGTSRPRVTAEDLRAMRHARMPASSRAPAIG